MFRFCLSPMDDLIFSSADSLNNDVLAKAIAEISEVQEHTGIVRSVSNGDFTVTEIETMEKSYGAGIGKPLPPSKQKR